MAGRECAERGCDTKDLEDAILLHELFDGEHRRITERLWANRGLCPWWPLRFPR
jgi:hypothetical protein